MICFGVNFQIISKTSQIHTRKNTTLIQRKNSKKQTDKINLSLRNLVNAKSMLGCSPPTPSSENSLLKYQKKIIKNAIQGKKTI